MPSSVLRLLVVEDNRADVDLVAELLADVPGIRVELEWVDRLAKAIERAAESDVDAVLLDLSLPDSSGLDTVGRMHAAVPDVPIVVCTSVDDEALGAQALGRGAQDYLVKASTDGRGLARTIRYAIERQRLISANRGKDQFLAILSHELRTPLTAMLGWVRMLRTGRLRPEQVSQALESIDRNTRVQTRLINDLLDVSRIVAGKLALDRQPVDLGDVAAAAIESLETDATAKAVRVERTVEDGELSVLGDAVRLQQVVGNLVSNAIKFSQSGGSVHVILRRHGDQVRLVVTDRGQGIEPDVLPYIFEHFRQADSSTTRRGGGLGLGLAIVQHLVTRHGGTVRAESDGAGLGATFTVDLPAVAVAAPRPAEADARRSTSDAAIRLDGARALVVDDHADSRRFVETVLSEAGAAVTLADSAGEALRLLAAGTFDVLVSDLGMPGLDGFDLMQRMRELERERGGERIPAIALTAHAATEDRARVLASGFQAHATKPIDPADLVQLVSAMLRVGEARRAS